MNTTINTTTINNANAMTFFKVPEKYIRKEELVPVNDKPYIQYTEQTIHDEQYRTITQYHGCQITIEDFKKFASNGDKIISWFGEDLVKEYLPHLLPGELISEDFHRTNSALSMVKHWNNHYLFNKPVKGKVVEYKGEWRKEHDEMGYKVLSPNVQYCSLYEGPMIKYCLLRKFPWLKKFKIDVYGVSSQKHYEFYATMTSTKGEKKSLYVPIEALFEHNPDIITKRMEEYFGWYHKKLSPNKEGEKKYQNAMSVLKYAECKKFYEYVKNGRDDEASVKEQEKVYEIKVYGKRYKYVLICTEKGRLATPLTFNSFDEAHRALADRINTWYVGKREDEVLSINYNLEGGRIKASIGSAYEGIVVRIEM